MRESVRSPVQRSLIRSLGEELFYSPGEKKEFLPVVGGGIPLSNKTSGVLFVPNIVFPSTTYYSYNSFLGQSNLRTQWTVQSVAISFSTLVAMAEPEDLKISVGSSSLSNDVTLIAIPAGGSRKKEEFVVGTALKLYILELYGPITIQGVPLEIEFSLTGRTSEVGQQNIIIVKPEVEVTYLQTFRGS